MSEKRITMKARLKCAEWLAYCLEIGWTKDQLDGLEEMWWKFRDHNGNLKPSSASPDTTPAPLTYTPAQVIEMVTTAFNDGIGYGKDLAKGRTDVLKVDRHKQLLTTLGLNQ